MAKPKPRPKNPRPMRLTERDKLMLQTLRDFEGLMSRRQLARLFFHGNEDTAKKRLRLLYENGYIRQPNEREMHRLPAHEWIYWLDRAGLELVAGLRGDEPLITDTARAEAPQWAKIEHDLALNDVRLTIMAALEKLPSLSFVEWICEKTLAHWADTIEWTQANKRDATKKFVMDGFFTVRLINPQTQRRKVFAYLLEIDRGTHSNPAFADEKVRPGIAYIHHPIYEARFGISYGRYLVVTTGGDRLENMIRQTRRVEGGEIFYFTTFRDLTPETVFTQPIWRSSTQPEPFALIPT